jgi:hypothetical protein
MGKAFGQREIIHSHLNPFRGVILLLTLTQF